MKEKLTISIKMKMTRKQICEARITLLNNQTYLAKIYPNNQS